MIIFVKYAIVSRKVRFSFFVNFSFFFKQNSVFFIPKAFPGHCGAIVIFHRILRNFWYYLRIFGALLKNRSDKYKII